MDVADTDCEMTSTDHAPGGDDDSPNSPDWEADTDIEAEAGDYYFYTVERNEPTYGSADDLVKDADMIITGTVTDITFEALSSDLSSLKNGIDDYRDGDIVTIYTVTVDQTLGGGYKASRGSSIDVYVYGGDGYQYHDEQFALTHGSHLPVVDNMGAIYNGEDYVFVLDFDYDANVWTLHSYEAGTAPIYGYTGYGFEASEIINACK